MASYKRITVFVKELPHVAIRGAAEELLIGVERCISHNCQPHKADAGHELPTNKLLLLLLKHRDRQVRIEKGLNLFLCLPVWSRRFLYCFGLGWTTTRVLLTVSSLWVYENYIFLGKSVALYQLTLLFQSVDALLLKILKLVQRNPKIFVSHVNNHKGIDDLLNHKEHETVWINSNVRTSWAKLSNRVCSIKASTCEYHNEDPVNSPLSHDAFLGLISLNTFLKSSQLE